MREKTIGILGGMGPEATSDVFRRIIRFTKVKTDSEHIRVIIDSNPKIPDRTRAILGNGISPIDEMVATARKIQTAGADFLIIPCMTAHYFVEELEKSIDIPIINALKETNKYIDSQYPSMKKIGLLATTGTITTGLFQKALKNKIVIIPEKKEQENLVMDTIYGINGIKAGNTSVEVVEKFIKVVEKLQEEGVEGIIAGCTEVGLVLSSKDIDIPLIDPLTVLAKTAVVLAKNL
ncbi:aspartate racemase [Natronincola peptidivorans]|uniref:Aspartate racemase n=1 Tax=Natronincola peptidivorans TaxID=426128 RepID=A0A1I0D4U9_9FIRM|nr:amino acid racemase [Natronincola peptidivorans]SET27178.1 aspartate racemase [Natronincola peptidivorans]